MSTNLPGFFQGTEMPTAGWWETLWPDPAAVLAAVGMKAGVEAVDLCCGNGWFTMPMARIAKHVVAIDISAALLESGRSRITEGGVTNCDFRWGDAYELVALLGRRTVDFVFMANTFHGVPDRPRLARAVHDALRPGGRFAIVNWHPRPREETTVLGEPRGPRTELRLSARETIETARAGGLTPVEVVEIPPDHYGAIFELRGK